MSLSIGSSKYDKLRLKLNLKNYNKYEKNVPTLLKQKSKENNIESNILTNE